MKIGIIGAGQLGRMLALAGYPLGSRFHFLDRSADAPGAQVGGIVIGAFDDATKLAELADKVDIMTFDVENVPAPLLQSVARQRPFLPPVAALAATQDRCDEKRLFDELDIPTPQWHTVSTRTELDSAVAATGLPAVLKTRRLGYDGRGQAVLRSEADLSDAWQRLGAVPLILEQFQHFEREVSVIGARNTHGQSVCYALTENVHHEGILHQSRAPYEAPQLQSEAEQYLQRIFARFDYAGVMTIEFFVVGGRLIANEIAPRVHNSGHWTIEGAATSQFENHIRAIQGLPLGDTRCHGYSAMVNFLGRMPPPEAVLAVRGAHYHDYGKTARPLRKLGHCTINADSEAARDKSLGEVLAAVGR